MPPPLPGPSGTFTGPNLLVQGDALGAYIPVIDPERNIVRTFTNVGPQGGYCTRSGVVVPEGSLWADDVYYCDFPGERMLSKVSFSINGNPLDEYEQYSYVFYRNFKLKQDKLVGYYRAVGQELPHPAYGMSDGYRVGMTVLDGPQTPKQVQPALQIWQKLLFWFNLDCSLALPSAAIPFGQRYINVELEQA